MPPIRSTEQPESSKSTGSATDIALEIISKYKAQQKITLNTNNKSRKKKPPNIITAFQTWFQRFGIPSAYYVSANDLPIPPTLPSETAAQSLQSGMTSASFLPPLTSCTGTLNTVATEGSLVSASNPINNLEGSPSNVIPSTIIQKITPSAVTKGNLIDDLHWRFEETPPAGTTGLNPYKSVFTLTAPHAFEPRPTCQELHTRIKSALIWIKNTYSNAKLLVPDTWKVLEESQGYYDLPEAYWACLEESGFTPEDPGPATSQVTTPPPDNSDELVAPSSLIPCDPVMKALLTKFKLVGDRENDRQVSLDLSAMLKIMNKNVAAVKIHRSMQDILFSHGHIIGGAELVTISEIKRRDAEECAGDITINSGGDRQDAPKYVFVNWMQSEGQKRGESTAKSQSEAVVDGSHLLRFVWPDKKLFDNHGHESISWPSPLVYYGSQAQPDGWIRPKAEQLPDWNPMLLPVLYAQECKRMDRKTPNVVAQLAIALQPTLVELIVFYLDTRSSPEAPIPPWLFLFGIVYTDDGFDVYAHYPRYTEGRWGATSVRLLTFQSIFETGVPRSRLRALAVVLRMRSHASFLLRQLQRWDGYRRCLSWMTVPF